MEVILAIFRIFHQVSVFYCGIHFSAWPIFSRRFTLVNTADSCSHLVRPKELSTFPQLFSLAYCFEPCRNILKLQKGPSLHFFPVIRKVLNISVVPPPMVYRKTTDKIRDTPHPKFLDAKKFQKHQRVSIRNFSVLWDEKKSLAITRV